MGLARLNDRNGEVFKPVEEQELPLRMPSSRLATSGSVHIWDTPFLCDAGVWWSVAAAVCL